MRYGYYGIKNKIEVKEGFTNRLNQASIDFRKDMRQKVRDILGASYEFSLARDPRKFGVADKLYVQRRTVESKVSAIRALGLRCELSASKGAIRIFYPNQR